MRTTLVPVFVSMLCVLATPHAQAEPVEALATIRFGAGTDRLGLDMKSGDAMRPLFFGIDAAGNMHIPDSEKNRIAVYTRSGSFVREVIGVTGITPRMNFFDLSPDGSYVVFSDGALTLHSASGEEQWRAPFPLGILPSAILCGDEAVYSILASVGTMECFAIPFTPPYSAYSSIKAGITGPIATIKVGGSLYSWLLSDMPGIHSDFIIDSFESYATATLVGAFKNGLSVWRSEGSLGKQLYFIKSSGRLVRAIRLGDLVDDENTWHAIRVAACKESIILAILSITDEAILIKSIVVSE